MGNGATGCGLWNMVIRGDLEASGDTDFQVRSTLD